MSSQTRADPHVDLGQAETSREEKASISAEDLRAEVETWAARMSVRPAAVQIRPMKRKWASCSSKGRLTFDAGLLAQPAAFRREVIVHELLHLKVPNHAALFRALLAAYLGES